MHRRHFLQLGAGMAGAAMVPGCAHLSTRAAAADPGPAIPVDASYRPHVASSWIPRGALDEAAFRAAVEAATDFSWLGHGDRVLIKVALNSPNPFPATTDPWALQALVKLLKEKGAGTVYAGDQSGMGSVFLGPDKVRGSSRSCADRAGLLAAITEAGAEPVFFDELGYDAAIACLPDGDHHWPEPAWIPAFVEQVDHIVYLARVSAHAMADATLGLKLSVGWLRDDSRFVFHKGGAHFCSMYAQVNELAPIASRLRLVVSSGREVLSTIGPDIGAIARPDQGLVFASEDLLAHELLAYAWLRHARDHHTGQGAYSIDATVADNRSGFNRMLMRFVGSAEQRSGLIADIPPFRPGNVADHPAIRDLARRRGGTPGGIQWETTNSHPDAGVTAALAGAMGVG
jgi:uncharacterized protein (DUF362 family)